MRLDKFLSNSGAGSRKEVKEFIKKKLVKVNDILIVKSDYEVKENDKVYLKGNEVKYEEFFYLMMNKPANYLSANYDYKDLTVFDLIDKRYHRGFCIGRLDKDSEGLLLISNDGILAHNILNPKKDIFKEYYVECETKILDSAIDLFQNGIVIDNDYKCKSAKLIINQDRFSARVFISEGKFHQIKKMFLAINNKVTYLKRLKIGNISLDENLKLGEYRALNSQELENLLFLKDKC